jgi:hypothetical protein
MKSLEIQKFASGHHRLRKDHCLCERCFRLLDQEAKKFKQESVGETEMPRDEKGARNNLANYEEGWNKNRFTQNQKLSHCIRTQKLASAKMTEKDQDSSIGSENTRGEYYFIIW